MCLSSFFPVLETWKRALPRVLIRWGRDPRKGNFDTNHCLVILADVAMAKTHCNIWTS
jgi:hypothetical protein